MASGICDNCGNFKELKVFVKDRMGSFAFCSRQCLEEFPGDRQPWPAKKREEEFEAAAQRAATEPGHVYAQLELAIAAHATRKLDVALDAYLKALALGIPSVRDAGLAKWRYSVLLRKRDPSSAEYYSGEAEKDLRKASRSTPNDLEILRALDALYSRLGKNREGAAVRQRIKQLEVKQSILGSSSTETPLRDPTGYLFEDRCLQLIRQFRFEAELTNQTGDGGIDIIAVDQRPFSKGKYVIQCKDWTNPVGEPVLRDLLGAVAAEDAVKGILITSGTFTRDARRFAEGKRLELIDGRDLEDLTAQSQQET